MMEKREFYPPRPREAKCENFARTEQPSTSMNKKNKNIRRFTEAQVKLLESMFETETKIEPWKKVQLAKELGLQPRQVAIWFQNKRARWQSKQMEKDYMMLKAKYDSLMSQFETMKKEKQSLFMQLQNLKERLEQPQGKGKDSNSLAGISSDGGSENEYTNCEYEVKACCSEKVLDERYTMGLDDDKKNTNTEYTGHGKIQEFQFIGVDGGGSSASPEKCSTNDLYGFFHQSSTDEQWWDFWS